MEKIFSRPKNLVPCNKLLIDTMFYRLISLCTPHPHESWIIDYIKQQKFTKFYKQREIKGNYIIWIGESETMFSAHMDIVGDVSKNNKAINTIDLIEMMEDPDNKEYYWGAKRMCVDGKTVSFQPSTLGADDKVGCYILLKMIQAKIPGMYVFHAGEERGGIGSKFLYDNHKDLFKGIKRAIAYDRAGYEDVIGNQRCRRCASTEFTSALAKELNQYTPPKISFKGDIHGSFTDTASYMDIIPECTNISAGYFNQHGNTEYVDYAWLRDHLLPIALKIKYEELPTVRDPKAVVAYTRNYDYSGYYGDYSGGYQGNYSKVANIKPLDYKEIKDNTPDYKLPDWELTDGWIEECSTGTFKRIVERSVKLMCYNLKDRDVLASDYFNLLEYNHILEQELQSLEAQIAIMEDKLDKENQPSDEQLAEIAAKIADFDDPINEDIYIFDKKHLIKNLSNLCINRNFSDTLKGYPAKFASKQLKFLKEIDTKVKKEELSNNKIKKMNSAIFHMSFWLNNGAMDLTDPDKELLTTVKNYMIDHKDERGWLTQRKDSSDAS